MLRDDVPPPAFMAADHTRYLGSEPIDAARYYSPEFHLLELEKMWPAVWQFAAREEDLPEPGDYVTYDNAGRSYLIVRQDGWLAARLPQRLPAPGAQAQDRQRQRRAVRLPVPRLCLEHRWQPAQYPLPVGFWPSD